MTAFDRLHPAVQHHIVNSLGWRGLRPIQEQAAGPILDGRHVLALAPTAGGKTEAAALPAFSRMLAGRWSGLSVLYVCPIRALLNNLEPRLSRYGALLGRTVGLWHGDVRPAKRKAMLRDPPDLLLTTPESIEAMLIAPRVEHRAFLGGVRMMVADELHAFAGDDRGWHLLALLERLDRITGRMVQRIGLSATVGDPEAMLAWFAGDRPPGRTVIRREAGAPTAAEVRIDHVGSHDNAALVLSRLHQGEKRLVFCDSRARVESLAARLRDLGTTAFVSHSALSLDERRRAEDAFAQSTDCVICATGTLELGIDVGDLDRVIQIDAPTSVASFLQRMGRTGRRAGTQRNCLFLCTDTEAVLFAAGIVRLWRDGYTEPVAAPPIPWHIFGQQVMALVRQEGSLARPDWTSWLTGVPAFRGDGVAETADAILAFMLKEEVLAEDQGVLGIGRRGEALFGRRYFLDLVSSFTTPLLIGVRHGRIELGAVDPVCLTEKPDRSPVLLLGGRSWAVTHIDWSARVCFVEPSRELGRSQWLGSSRAARFELCQAIRRVLGEGLPAEHLSRRAGTLLETLREDFPWCDDPRPLLLAGPDGRLDLWTFAGARANATIGAALAACGLEAGRPDDLRIPLGRSADPAAVRTTLRALDPAALEPPVPDRLLKELKFHECLPEAVARSVLARRQADPAGVEAVLGAEVRLVQTG